MKRIKPDESFNNGIFEVARFGNVIETINHMTPEEHSTYINEISKKYCEKKEEIDALIRKIRSLIREAEPCNLMNYLLFMNQMVMVNKISETSYTDEENMQLKCVEYAQSILVSEYEFGQYDSEDESLYGEIVCKISELYEKMHHFYFYWGSKRDLMITEDEREYIIFSQLMDMVRGTQYQVFRMPILRETLSPYEDIVKEAYDIDMETLFCGLDQLEKNLSSGRLQAMNNLIKQMNRLEEFDIQNLPEDYLEEGRTYAMQAIGLDLFDVKKSTNWPNDLIQDLSLEIGEDKLFLSEGEFCGWPIRTLPIKMKPFIKIGEIYYCFDYYNLFDNFYRAFRKITVEKIQNGVDRWKKIQGHSSEKTVSDVFRSLLPGSKIHLSNFYPIGSRESAENDILIEYKDVLIIVEVKAGAFTPSPAITDYQSHINALNSLVIKAEKQALRVKKYIESAEKVYFYDGDDLEAKTFSIVKSNYSQIYLFDVTLADFNDIAAHMEKIKVADAKEDIIVLSLNDLWVYKAYFDSPLQFVHFIKQRQLATRAKAMSISDELDHLGLYIDKNMYALDILNLEKGYVTYGGYRESLDKYFSMIHIGKDVDKPEQKITKEIKKILEICVTKNDCNIVRFSNFILDMSEEAREIFSDSIQKLAKRERELRKMIPATFFGDLSYILLVKEPNIEYISKENQQKYALATLAKNKREYIFRIEIELNMKEEIIDVDFDYFIQSDIRENERKQLTRLGDYYMQSRMQSFIIQNHKKKIYPNDYCPCGSGKKYKKCCGR